MNDDRITRVPLHDVRQNEANPRTITPENLKKLVRSILEFPRMLQVRPVITDETGLILGGNMRHKALSEIADMSEDEIMAEIVTLRSVQRKVRDEQEQLADFWKKWLKSPYLYAIRETELSEDDKMEFVIKDNVHAGQWCEALQIAKDRPSGEVCWNDVRGDIEQLVSSFEWSRAQGFNCNSSERRAKFYGMTMADYMHWLWNNPQAGQSPYKLFEGALVPSRKDAEGNIIYKFNGARF